MIYEDNQIRERVLKLIHREGITQREFADRIGRIPSNVSIILRGERKIPRTFTNEVLNAFPGVRRDWLVFGEGAMYENEDANEQDTPLHTRPRLPKSLTGGMLTDYYEGEKRSLCQEKPIISQFPDYDFTIILKNTRMSPKYDRGDELAFKKSTIIEWGNDYLIDTPEGPKFKKIYDNGSTVRCVSYNKEEFPEFEVPKDKIFGFYRCVGALRIM